MRFSPALPTCHCSSCPLSTQCSRAFPFIEKRFLSRSSDISFKLPRVSRKVILIIPEVGKERTHVMTCLQCVVLRYKRQTDMQTKKPTGKGTLHKKHFDDSMVRIKTSAQHMKGCWASPNFPTHICDFEPVCGLGCVVGNVLGPARMMGRSNPMSRESPFGKETCRKGVEIASF